MEFYIKTLEPGKKVLVKKGITCSKPWKSIYAPGLLTSGKVPYYRAKNEKNRYALFHLGSKEPITKWYPRLVVESLLLGNSEVFSAQRENDEKTALFHISEPRKAWSRWFTSLKCTGVLDGETDYFAGELKGRWKLYHVDDPKTPVSRGFKDISFSGLLVSRKIPYYVGHNDLDHEALFKENTRISGWFLTIPSWGLLSGQSPYYHAFLLSGKQAIFHENGAQVSQELDSIDIRGLLQGTSSYYRAQSLRKHALYHVDAGKVSQDFDDIIVTELLNNKSFYYAGITGETVRFFNVKSVSPISLSLRLGIDIDLHEIPKAPLLNDNTPVIYMKGCEKPLRPILRKTRKL